MVEEPPDMDPEELRRLIPRWRRMALASANRTDGIRIFWLDDDAVVDAGRRLWLARRRRRGDE